MNKQDKVIPQEVSFMDLIKEINDLKLKRFNLRGAIKEFINNNPDDNFNNDNFKLILKDN